MFVRNCWYAAAWSREVGRKPFGRTLLGMPIVFYRRGDGRPVAMEDRCCHRSLPLSRGRVVGDDLQCGYHGLTFQPDGACVRVPGQSTVPPDARVRTYAAVERHGWIWIWPGEAHRADANAIPDVSWHDDPGWTVSGDYRHVRCHYELMNDIQLDATHATYVHPGTFGSDAIQETPPKVRRDGGRLRIRRWILDRPPPPIWAVARNFPAHVDRWILTEFVPPSACHFDIGAAEAGTGAPDGDRSRGVSHRTVHLMTPESDSTTHYFWAVGRNYRQDDHALSETLHRNIGRTFDEDVAIVEAQQRALERGAFTQVDVNADVATIQARRLVAELLAEERRSEPSA